MRTYNPKKNSESKASKQSPKVIKKTSVQVDIENEPVRLNKILADSGVSSRRKADELIASGVVKVNGNVITELGTKAKKTDFITVNGDPIKQIEHLTYILLNKPKNVITTSSDEKNRKTVMDIIRSRARVYPVGRLDRNTTGVLLFTNDGELANKLIHPKYQIPRVYIAGLDKPLKLEDARKIAEGVELDDGKTSPCELFVNPDDKKLVTITLTEGKNHEIKRIFEHFNYEVKKLDRKSFANLTVKGMNRGEFRHLNRSELNALKKLVSNK